MRIIIIYNLPMPTFYTQNFTTASLEKQLRARMSRSAIIFIFVLLSHGLLLAVISVFHRTANTPTQIPSLPMAFLLQATAPPASDSASPTGTAKLQTESRQTFMQKESAPSKEQESPRKVIRELETEIGASDGMQNSTAPSIATDQGPARNESKSVDQKSDTNQSIGAEHVADSLPQFDVHYLTNPAPQYPSLSRRAGEEGKVVLRVMVEVSGLPSKVIVSTSSGYERLDKAAVASVSQWKFAPARRDQNPVPAWVLVPVVFSLKAAS